MGADVLLHPPAPPFLARRRCVGGRANAALLGPRSIGGGLGQVRACRHALGPVWRSDCIVAFADCVVFSAQGKVSLASVLGRADASLDALVNSVQA